MENRTMASAGESDLSLLASPRKTNVSGLLMERGAGPILLMSGSAYAAAYVVGGVIGLSPWGALLAIGGTVLVLLGLKLVAARTS